MAERTPRAVRLGRIGGVVCCGNVVFDIPVWPVEQLKWSTTAWVEILDEGIGGNGANTSSALGMLGVPIRLIGITGADARGDRLMEILQNAGVDTSLMMRSHAGPTAASVAVVNANGDRAFLHRPGASMELEPDSVQFNDLEGFTHFHLANPFALPKLRRDTGSVMRRAKEAGLTTSMDTGWDSLGRWMEDLGPALPYTDLLFVNDAEARQLGRLEDLEGAASNLRAAGPADVVLKLGAEGCAIHDDGGVTRVPGFEVKAIDTTGAGDCFAGAFLAALHHGYSMAESARLANAIGALNVEKIGATTGLKRLPELLEWVEAREKA